MMPPDSIAAIWFHSPLQGFLSRNGIPKEPKDPAHIVVKPMAVAYESCPFQMQRSVLIKQIVSDLHACDLSKKQIMTSKR